MFVYAHMDDETIMSYATIHKLKTNNKLKVITLCGNSRIDDINYKSRQNAHSDILNSLDIEYIRYPNNDLCLDKNTIHKHIDENVKDFKPTTIFTHSMKDLHTEHRMVFDSVMLLSRNINKSPIKRILTAVSPTYSQTYGQYGMFNPNYFVSFDKEIMKEKEKFLKLYKTELYQDGNDCRSINSIKNWNKMYGYTMNCDYCEPYEQIFSCI